MWPFLDLVLLILIIYIALWIDRVLHKPKFIQTFPQSIKKPNTGPVHESLKMKMNSMESVNNLIYLTQLSETWNINTLQKWQLSDC